MTDSKQLIRIRASDVEFYFQNGELIARRFTNPDVEETSKLYVLKSFCHFDGKIITDAENRYIKRAVDILARAQWQETATENLTLSLKMRVLLSGNAAMEIAVERATKTGRIKGFQRLVALKITHET